MACRYLREDAIAEFASADDTRWWLPGGTNDTDIDHFYTPTVFYDPFGNATTITYWDDTGTSYYLLPHTTTDAVGNVTTVNEYNWYNLQPTRITDINENEGHIVYDALGMAVAAALMEKDGSVTGDAIAGIDPNDASDISNQSDFFTDPESVAHDLLQGATWRCVYELSASPVAVGMIARELHNSEDPDSPVLINLTYTDGLGRVAMKKVQAAPAEGDTDIRWIGSGKVIYNNKGKEVIQYEPYFTDTPLFDTSEYAASHGVSPKIHYDALGRVFRTDMPDGSFTKTEWDAWKQVQYDANDTVDDSEWYTAALAGTDEEADAANKAHEHYNTPTVMHLDTLGREFYTVQHNRTLPSWDDEYYESYINLDIKGNRRAIHDARMLVSLDYTYTLLKAAVRQVSIDSGVGYALLDVAGQPLHNWDADERQFRFTYDGLRRQLTKSVDSGMGPKVLEIMEYGEGVTDDIVHNLRGHVHRIYDGAGLQTIAEYEFGGKPQTTARRYITDDAQQPDWSTIGGVSMEVDIYITKVTYDAVARLHTVIAPDSSIVTYAYSVSGLLFNVRVDDIHGLDSDIINEIYYNAKGQRLKVKYENGATTTYEYDANTFSVTRIRTTRSSDSAVLQDLLYWYDPVGNITLQKDDAQQTVFYDNTVAEPTNDYTYDALYRLIKCEGREHAGSNAAVSYNDSTRIGKNPLPTDASAMRRYAQYYEYDGVGNMTKMRHTTSGGTGNWTREFDIDSTSNRLTDSSIGSNGTGTESYTYDARGNMIDGMNHLLSLEYNEGNRLEKVEITATVTAYYQYDGNGQRIRKVILNTTAGIKQVRKYVGEWEVYQKIDVGTNAIILERTSLNIDDDGKRIAIIETPTIDTMGTGEVQLLRYLFSNNVNTTSLELDENAAIITYEEYYPFGSTSYQGGRSVAECSLKRYRYTDKERDEETGMNYHGARYYVLWLARWCAVDPLEYKYSPESSYTYCHNNPIKCIDPSGEATIEKKHMEGTDKNKPKELGVFHAKGKRMGFFERLSRKASRFFDAIGDGLKEIGNGIKEGVMNLSNFAGYLLNAVVSNILLGALRADTKDAGKYSTAAGIGQFVGDLLSLVITAGETAVGIIGILGGGVISLGGFTAPVGALSITAGVALSAHGAIAFSETAKKLGKTIGRLFEGQEGGTQTPSKTMWKGRDGDRLDVENPNPGQRPGNIHYQDKDGNKYYYDPNANSFPGAPRKVNEKLKDAKFVKAIQKALKYLGIKK